MYHSTSIFDTVSQSRQTRINSGFNESDNKYYVNHKTKTRINTAFQKTPHLSAYPLHTRVRMHVVRACARAHARSARVRVLIPW